jgi:hypothetical protein
MERMVDTQFFIGFYFDNLWGNESILLQKCLSNQCGWSSDENLMGQMRISKKQHRSDTIRASTGAALVGPKQI